MLGLYVRPTGWQSKIWVKAKTRLNDNRSLSVLTIYESVLVWMRRPEQVCQNWFKDFGFIWWCETRPLCARGLQRNGRKSLILQGSLLISRSVDVVHFRPFFCNVKIPVFVACASEGGVLQLNVYKTEICLWAKSLFSVTWCFFPAATGTLKELSVYLR